MNVIDAQPTVATAQVVHAHWVYGYTFPDGSCVQNVSGILSGQSDEELYEKLLTIPKVGPVLAGRIVDAIMEGKENKG